MLPFPLIYTDQYDLNFGDHVFPTRKYRLIRDLLLHKRVADPSDFLTPCVATRADLLRVHDESWIDRLDSGRLSYHEIMRLEVPYSRTMVQAAFLSAGGSIAAARFALEGRAAFNIGGGFHHAFPDHGEGFCAVNDIAVAIRAAQHSGLIRRALVVDCDVHQGNGTAEIFSLDATVYTLSIHQLNNYPFDKPPSTVDIDLDDGVGDLEYNQKLGSACRDAIELFHPDLILYVAGADPFFDDQLGGLALSKEGLYARDRLVFDLALRARVPVAVVLAGGYARYLEDTVEIHSNTVIALQESLRAHSETA